MKKNKAGGITLLDFKLEDKDILIKTAAWYQYKKRHTDQKNRTESLKKGPYTYGQFMRKEIRLYKGEWTVSLTIGVGKTGQSHEKEVDHYLTPYVKINSKWMKNLKGRQLLRAIAPQRSWQCYFGCHTENKGKNIKNKQWILSPSLSK